MNKIYIFCGLGSDKRAFGDMNFDGLDVDFMEWFTPEMNESIESYAQRYREIIKAENPILIGLSFGGVLAVEISKIIPVKKTILLASIKNKYEMPKKFKCVMKIAINYLIPTSLLNKHNFVMNRMFGVTKEVDIQLLKRILEDTDVHFIKWALNEIINWKNEEISQNIIQIHGSKDKMFPIKYVKPDYIIKGGGHSMTITHSEEVERIIKNICQ